MKLFKNLTIFITAGFYINVGVKHFTEPMWFMYIMPPYIPFHLELVYLSGFIEIILGLLLVFPSKRKIAAYGLILLLIAVYPANIYLALNEIPQKQIDISSFAASWVRLPLQFVLIGLAYWHSKK